ncbi:shikimate dehydrogenase [Paenibacillus aurantius]|uniref:Shikimate dehydrogenase (NADP(+)) n=1 Tax=Paenibacillus aurantius TaxID=2918900 RepID=A0AA96RHI9_9BACL|nr:shikimate dehydrogenase [Paenibacillus aurantius]WNQ13408.1 shikimate dehydrogenase [Paenibacillus aurantius]
MLDTQTVMYGVFGDPIAHSKSPLMLNRAFAEADLNAAYAAFHIRPGTLKDAVAGIRALGFRGVNVTIPHKVEVMDYLDHLDDGAKAIGAVNTIVNDHGVLTGYNTDGIGYVRSLKEETGVKLAGAKVVLLGAGGAARGLVYALAKEGAAKVTLANRTPGRAVELARAMGAYTSTEGIGLDQAKDAVEAADLVINTTQMGMHPNVEETPLDSSLLRPGMIVSDIVYNPRETRLLREAKARGAQVHGGLGMFIYQGAYAFEYWTGLPAPAAAMREAVEQSFSSN